MTLTETHENSKQQNAARVQATEQRKAFAVEIGNKLAADTAFVSEMAAQAMRKDESKVSSAQCCLYLGGDLDPQEIMRLPDQGTPEDTYDTEDGKGRGSVIWDLASCLPDGQEINKHLEWIKEAGKTGVSNPDNAYIGKRKETLMERRAYWAGRKQTIKNNMGETVELAKRLILANELEGLEAEIRTEEGNDMKVMSKTWNVIRVKDISKSKNADEHLKFMSVGAFLGLDTSKIKPEDKADPTKHYLAFVATGGRGKKSSGEGTAAASGASKVPAIDSTSKFEEYVAEVAAYLSDTPEGQKHFAALMRIVTDPKTGDDYILSLGDAVIALDGLWKHIERRYNQIREKQLASRTADPKVAKAS